MSAILRALRTFGNLLSVPGCLLYDWADEKLDPTPDISLLGDDVTRLLALAIEKGDESGA